MSLISYRFFLALPAAAILHRLLPSPRWKNGFLLLASLVFYGLYGMEHLLFLALSIGITYAGGLLMSRSRGRGRKAAFVLSLTLNLGLLAVCKYLGFLTENLNRLLGLVHGTPLPLPRLLLPVGLSFIVFQSSTYLFDLRSGAVEPERNLIRYALFVCFFPTIVSGPIQRARDFLPLLRERRDPSFEEGQSAAVQFLWGLFLKIVVADRIAQCTDLIFGDYLRYDGAVLLGGALLYGLQIYLDFAGYSQMAIAAARLFGFRLKPNFRQPYLAVSIADFWRRWHISLTGWFTEYVYIPLGGNRRGAFRRYLNILIVFLLSGLWHGASWTFVAWGLIHAGYQIAGHVTKPLRQRLRLPGTRPASALYRVFQRCFLYVLIALAWVFFRSGTLAQAGVYLRQILLNWHMGALFDSSLFRIGLSFADWNVLAVSLAAVLAVSLLREGGNERYRLSAQGPAGRAVLILLLFAAVLVFGIYGEGYSAASFIYAGF